MRWALAGLKGGRELQAGALRRKAVTQKVWARKIAVTSGAASSNRALAKNDRVRAGMGSRW